MKNYIFLIIFIIFNSSSIAQVGYQNYNLIESMNNIISKLEKSDIKYEKEDMYKDDEVGMLNGRLISVDPLYGNRNHFYDQYNRNIKFTAQTTCTRIKYEDDNGRIVFFYFDFNNKLMEIFVCEIKIEFDVLKETFRKKYGNPINVNQDKAEFKIPKFNALISLSKYVGVNITYENVVLKHAHFLKQYKEQKLAADKELKRKANAVNGF